MTIRPQIIAHRGASRLAPENTLAAAELAADLGADGFETDIQISLDGVPFLMHDPTLGRTTDVKHHFPNRTRQAGARFTWTELRQLDAGSWFVRDDPAGTLARGEVTPDMAACYPGLCIPSLAEALDVVRRRGLTFIFDLKVPPTGHPYRMTFFELVFKEIQAAGIDRQVWYLAGPRRMVWLGQAAPDMRRFRGANGVNPPAPQALLAAGYQAVNIDLSAPEEVIRAYRQAGLWVNVYVVDDPDIARVLYADGVNSITSNNVQELAPWSRSLP